MFGTGYTKLYVTQFNKIIKDWELKITSDYEGTKDEEKYYRVIRDGRKHYYYSNEEYKMHVGVEDGIIV